MKKKIIVKPDMDWQVKEYSRTQDFHLTLPYQFLLLCKLVDTPPQRLLIDFMDNLSCGSWKRQGRDQAKEKLIEYFLEHGYGQGHYSPEDLRQMFTEMDAVGLLFPNDDSDMIDTYAAWREKHYKYWFKKWWGKYRRK
jgi:hypothetical protein